MPRLSPGCTCCGVPTGYCRCSGDTEEYNYLKITMPGVDYTYTDDVSGVIDTASYGSFVASTAFGYPTFTSRILDCRACLIIPITGFSHSAYEQIFFFTDNMCGTMSVTWFVYRVNFVEGGGASDDLFSVVLDIYERGYLAGASGIYDQCPGGPIPATSAGNDGDEYVGSITENFVCSESQEDDFCNGDEITFTASGGSWAGAKFGGGLSLELPIAQRGESGSGADCEEDPGWDIDVDPSKWRTYIDKSNLTTSGYKFSSGTVRFQMMV